jgi:hypothetical protein
MSMHCLSCGFPRSCDKAKGLRDAVLRVLANPELLSQGLRLYPKGKTIKAKSQNRRGLNRTSVRLPLNSGCEVGRDFGLDVLAQKQCTLTLTVISSLKHHFLLRVLWRRMISLTKST